MRKFANMASTRVTATRELISVSECKTILPQNWMCAISTRWIPPFSRPSVAKAQMNLQCFSTLSYGRLLLSEMLTKSFFRLLASERWRKVLYSIDYSFLPSSLPLMSPLFVHSPKHVFQAFLWVTESAPHCIYHEDSKQVSAWWKVL
jgi:hypothetical protein